MLFLPVMLLTRSKTRADAIKLFPSFLDVNQILPVYYLEILLTKVTLSIKKEKEFYFELIFALWLNFDSVIFVEYKITTSFIFNLVSNVFIEIVFEFYVLNSLFSKDTVELYFFFDGLIERQTKKELPNEKRRTCRRGKCLCDWDWRGLLNPAAPEFPLLARPKTLSAGCPGSPLPSHTSFSASISVPVYYFLCSSSTHSRLRGQIASPFPSFGFLQLRCLRHENAFPTTTISIFHFQNTN